jgi:hypothetical protein
MVLSHFGVFELPHLEDVQIDFLHIDLAYALFLIYLCCANCVVNKNGHVINDVLLYHAHTYFAWSLLCEGTNEFLVWFLSPLHHDGDLSSRTTLFQAGGDDAGQPNLDTTPTYAKSPWTSKVNLIRYMSPFPPHVNGILLHTPSYDIARFTSTSTETWEEAQSLKSDVMEAWKRRRKKLDRSLRSSRPESPLLKTGVSAPQDRSLRSRSPESPVPSEELANTTCASPWTPFGECPETPRRLRHRPSRPESPAR